MWGNVFKWFYITGHNVPHSSHFEIVFCGIAFSCLEGLFEWKIMSFGLKNTPQIFQRKMDNIFGNYKEFTCTYIDDVLVFSKTKEEH